MNFEIVHTTEYQYEDSISLCHNTARLSPRARTGQSCKRTTMRILPQPDAMGEYMDYFGNKVVYFAIQQEHKKLVVTATSLVALDPSAFLLDHSQMSWEEAKRLMNEITPEFLDARAFMLETAMTSITPDIFAYARRSFSPGRSLYEAVLELMNRIHLDFEFMPGLTTIATPLDHVMDQHKGVCQDFAHLAIACIRSQGLSARYVSGYVETIPPPGKEKLSGVDASHAWFSVFVPQTGWIDFDPTNNMVPSDQHITIGWGRDYSDITPLKGVVFSSGQHALTVSVNVKRC
jgi:transglutaminase-like putative cysteine protease